MGSHQTSPSSLGRAARARPTLEASRGGGSGRAESGGYPSMEYRGGGLGALVAKPRREAVSSEGVRPSGESGADRETPPVGPPARNPSHRAERYGKARQETRPGGSSLRSGSSCLPDAFSGQNGLAVEDAHKSIKNGRNPHHLTEFTEAKPKRYGYFLFQRDGRFSCVIRQVASPLWLR